MSDTTDLVPRGQLAPNHLTKNLILLVPLVVSAGLTLLYFPTGSSESMVVTLQVELGEKIGYFLAVASLLYAGIMGIFVTFTRLTRPQRWSAVFWLLASAPFACCGPYLEELVVPFRSADDVEVGNQSYHLFHLTSRRKAEDSGRYRLGIEEGSDHLYLRCRIVGDLDLSEGPGTWSPLLRSALTGKTKDVSVRASRSGDVLVTAENHLLLTHVVETSETRAGGDPFAVIGPDEPVTPDDRAAFLLSDLRLPGTEAPKSNGVLTLDDLRKGAAHTNPEVRGTVLQWLKEHPDRPAELEPILHALESDPALRQK